MVGGGSGGGGSWLGLGPGRVVWLEKGSLCWRKQSVGVVAVEACIISLEVGLGGEWGCSHRARTTGQDRSCSGQAIPPKAQVTLLSCAVPVQVRCLGVS